jgi:hypothetical protein
VYRVVILCHGRVLAAHIGRKGPGSIHDRGGSRGRLKFAVGLDTVGRREEGVEKMAWVNARHVWRTDRSETTKRSPIGTISTAFRGYNKIMSHS